MKADNESNSIQHLRNILTSTDSNEEFLQQLTDLFPALIYVYDAEQRKLKYISRKITDLLGYSWEDVGTWDDLNKLVYEADQPLVQAELEKFYQLSGQESYTYKSRLNHKGGEYRYFKTQGTVLRRGENGKPASMLFMAEDISEQIKSEEEKKAARQLMDETEQMLRIGMWSWEKDSGKIEWTDGMFALMGYTREEISEISEEFFIAHVQQEEKQKVLNQIEEAFRTGEEFQIEFSVQQKGGQQIYISSQGKPVKSELGEVAKITGINRDISDQFLQTLAYKANIELQRQTEEMLNYGVFTWEISSEIMSWTTGLYDIFEMDKESSGSGISADWYLSRINEEDRDRFVQAMELCKDGKQDLDIEYSILAGNGVEKIVSTKAHLIKGANQEPLRLIGNTRDVTEFKRVQNELQRNLRELNRSNLDLEEFAYAASHDLQEPLRKITTFSSRLQQKFEPLLGEEGAMYIKRMQISAENMRSLIENLLELSRVSRTQQNFERVELNLLVKQALTELDLAIDESGATIEVGPLPAIDSIPSQLTQMFTNLLSNALKFKKEGQKPLITITAHKIGKQEKNELFLPVLNTYYRIDIADNGIGFDPEYEQQIFQIFQRLHGKSAFPGTGIGLTICKRIAERHNGHIYAKSKEGKGAVFSVVLPEKQ